MDNMHRYFFSQANNEKDELELPMNGNPDFNGDMDLDLCLEGTRTLLYIISSK